VWKPSVRDAGLAPELRIHDLRHTTVSMLISQNTYPKVVQEHMGHSSLAVTMDRYGHLYPEARTEVADALDQLFHARSDTA
jgi:integrase